MVVVLVILAASLRSLAFVYTDALWFTSVGMGEIWHTLFMVKMGLYLGFGALFFALTWVNLAFADRLAPSELTIHPADEAIIRYRHFMSKRAVVVRTALSLVFAALIASSVIGQWQHWLLFTNGGSFKYTDPIFHMNAGFYVFKLPFLEFLVSWMFMSLILITVLTMLESFMVGGIRFHGDPPRVTPQVKAHLSVLLAAIVLDRAASYLLGRYALVYSGNAYVQGAGYTDVHTRLPALELLIWISVAAAVVLLLNVKRQGWTLPVLAVGLWALVAVVVGGIYPALVQTFEVTPAQATLEQPYIAHNIAATGYAMGINHAKVVPFSASSRPTSAQVQSSSSELADVSLWNPNLTIQTFQKLQAIRSYYSFQSMALDRYDINGKLTPVVVGVRQVNPANIPAPSWVNTHLEYTHGYGAIVGLANTVGNGGAPTIPVGNVPPQVAAGYPSIKEASVYYGVKQPGYVVVDTKQPEIDYQLANGQQKLTHYHGSGGVPMGSLLTKAAFALRFKDVNLVVSSQLGPHAKIMYVRGIDSRVEKVAPFLRVGSNPYPVIVNGQIDWIVNGYTTSLHFPYGQDAITSNLPPSSQLNQSNFNYIRNSVKIVTNAYTGKMTFYAVDQNDPILQAWERVFPHMFTPGSKMPSQLRAHLRYPKDLFTIQAAMVGRYHLTNPSAFYNASNAWSVSQSPGSGPPSAALGTTFAKNSLGQEVSTGQVSRMNPEYELIQAPGSTDPSFDLVDAFVPVSQGSQIQTLAAFMTAGSDPNNYGQLTLYVAPRGQSIDGPSLVDARIQANAAISREITLLGQNGSQVILGHVAMIPVGQSILYVRPLYVQASRNALPVLDDVIAVMGSRIAMATSLQSAVSQVIGTNVSLPSSTSVPSTSSSSNISTTTVPPGTALTSEESKLASEAASMYAQAQSDLKAGNLGGYQSEVTQMGAVVQQLDSLFGGSGSGSSGSSTGTSGTGSSSGSGSASSTSGTGGASTTGSSTSGTGGTGSGGGSSGSGSATAGSGSATAGSGSATAGSGSATAGSGSASSTSSSGGGAPSPAVAKGSSGREPSSGSSTSTGGSSTANPSGEGIA
ncbi:MAG: UPF0182 family membrane protein [Acidimicrobiales bacterium]